MDLMKSTGKALQKARKKAGKRAAELLGEDTVDSLRSIGGDLRQAGSQAASAAREVWEDCGEDALRAGEQVSDFTEEVLEDCDNEVLRNARDFYSGAAKKVYSGEYKEELRQSMDRAAVRRKQRAMIRQKNRQQRRRTMKKATVFFVCVILAAFLIFSAALWFSRHGGGTRAHGAESRPASAQILPEDTKTDPLCGSVFSWTAAAAAPARL